MAKRKHVHPRALILTQVVGGIERRADAERRQIVRLLGALRLHLESAIESSLLPATGEPDPNCEADVYNVAKDRRDLELAKELTIRLRRK